MTVTDVDLMQFANSARWLLEKLAAREINGPITVGKNGEPIAVIIRAQAYTPKLGRFNMLPNGDILCSGCGETVINPNPYNLETALRAANEHWNDTHREHR